MIKKSYFTENFKIGNAVFDNNILLAPMAGVTDRAFRVLCKEQGAGITFTEMISAKGVHYDSRKSLELAVLDPTEKPAAVQIFGCEPEYMAAAAEIFVCSGASMIDINMGCPMPKITSNGDGSALMNDIGLAARVVEAVVRAVKVPVSVKMRRGYDSKKEEQAVELARAAEAAGASMVTVHGRFRDQLYSGRSDRGIIKKVKEAVRIPVIGNGDILTPADAEELMAETGCDGIMIGRGSYGNPWIFADMKHYFTGHGSPVARNVKETMLRHLKMAVNFKGEYVGIREMRSHLSWYLKGLHGSAAMRNRICRAESVEEIADLIENFFSGREEDPYGQN
jgi:nifR3 family TIM-barrel protein